MPSSEQTSPEQFSGTFLFVNADAGQLSTASHRKAIDTHVQSQYHRWRREQSARTLRQSTYLPVRSQSTVHNSSDDSDRPGTKKPLALKLPRVRGPMPRFQVERPNHNGDRRAIVPSPTTALMKGNSDPFETTAIAITPDISRMMAYSSTWRMPTMFGPPKPVSDSYNISAANEALVFALTDSCHGQSSLAMVAVLLANITGDRADTRTALTLRNRTYAMIQTRMKSSGYQPDRRTIDGIETFFGVEMALRNLEAARAHLRLVEFVFSRPYPDDSLVFRVKERLLWLDMHFSSRYLTRPLLHLQSWLPGFLDADWRTLLASPFDHSFEYPSPAIHPSICDREVRQIFLELFELLDLDRLLTMRPHLITGEIFRWMHMRKVDCEARLIHCYFGSDEADISPHSSQSNLSAEPTRDLSTMCICIAALSWSGLAFGMRQRMEGNRPLPDHLHNTLFRYPEADLDHGMDPELLLWILYVGSMMDELAPNACNRPGWYTKRFTAQAKRLQLISWAGIRRVLQQFLLSDSLLPDHAKWFDDHLLEDLQEPRLESIN